MKHGFLSTCFLIANSKKIKKYIYLIFRQLYINFVFGFSKKKSGGLPKNVKILETNCRQI